MKSTRKSYGEFLVNEGEINKNIIVLDADLSAATCTNMFKDKFSERHINIGIAEADLVGTATGLALSGKKVFASSFAMFLAGRAYEQVRNSVCYNHADVNLVATHSGLAVGEDGPTHQCLEDISLMNTIPEMTVLCPSDEYSTKNILKTALVNVGPKYIRLGRNDVENIYNENETFEIGKSKSHGEGKDATIFTAGNTLHIALEAKEKLKKQNVDIRVVDLYSLKPVDKDVIIKCSKETNKLITIEDHSIIGGIGSIVSNVLTEYNPKKLIKIGVNDTFGKSGSYKEVYKLFGLTVENIVDKVINN